MVVLFILSRCTPGDPVKAAIQGDETENNLSIQELNHSTGRYRQMAQRLGFDLPVFYWSILPSNYPDTLHRVVHYHEKKQLLLWLNKYGNWNHIQAYRNAQTEFENALFNIRPTKGNSWIQLRNDFRNLQWYADEVSSEAILQQWKKVLTVDATLTPLAPSWQNLWHKWDTMKSHKVTAQKFVPKWVWHGFDNQWHHWFSRAIQGDFGISYYNGLKVWDKIRAPLSFSLQLNLMVLILVLSIGLTLGIVIGYWTGKRDQWAVAGLLLLYALPVPWVGTALVVFFTTPEYGMQWFPSIGLGEPDPQFPRWVQWYISVSHLTLPLLTLSYGSIAIIARQVRTNVKEVLQMDYVRAAIAKGLTPRQVLRKHVLPNALYPMIGLIATLLPALVAGSFIVEYIFALPGIGREAIQALVGKDWPVVFGITLLTSVLIVTGNLLADILYAWADPTVQWNQDTSNKRAPNG